MHARNRFFHRLKLSLALCAGLSILFGCGGSNQANAPETIKASAQKTQFSKEAASLASPQAAATIRMHYHRAQHDAAQWGVYSWWGPVTPSQAWITDRFMLSNADAFGGFVDIPIDPGKPAIWFLVTDGFGNKNCGNDQHADFNADIATKGQEVWMLEGDCTVYSSVPAISFGNLSNATAHFLTADTIAWPGVANSGSYKLFYAENGGLGSDISGVTGADGSISLSINNSG